MRQRCIERAVSTLLEDETLRDAFLNDPHRALLDLLECDAHLTHSEITTLTALDSALWEQIAEYLEPAFARAA